ncbi:MAG: flagellar motor switch protein FliN [Pyrinomonadaceae bacterium]
MSIGTDLDTQLLMLYSPGGSLEAQPGTAASAGGSSTTSNTAATPPVMNSPDQANNAAAPPPPAAVAPPPPGAQPAPSRRQVQKKNDDQPRNFERLMDVELEVVVRFGVTSLPLRDVVAMGTGSMIELDRSVSEPVELLVNGRQFARGEVVVIDGYYGVRVTEVQTVADKPITLV